MLLRQPLIVGLIAAGIAVGPEVLGLVEASSRSSCSPRSASRCCCSSSG
jgi:hypothetical protein